jgi:hypothetical protein
MPKIIISYRRSDSDAIAGRIRDRLASYYGDRSIFMDIDNIPFGADFREHIQNAIAQNDLLLAVVGPHWSGPPDAAHRRISDEMDLVRIEIETAMRHGIPVVPVLVNGAAMPKPEELPAPLKDFSFKNAAQVDSGREFHQHVDRLIRSMDKLLKRTPRLRIPPPVLYAGAGVLAAAAIAGVVVLFAGMLPPRAPVADAKKGSPEPVQVARTVIEFADVQVGREPVAARPYLHKLGVSVGSREPRDSELVIVNNRAIYEGGAITPTSSQNFLTQINTGNVVAHFVLSFAKTPDGFTFSRPALYAATDSGITHPGWTAVALDSRGQPLSSQSESLIRSFTTVAARTYTLRAPAFDRIAAVRFESDPRLGGKPFAAFSALLIERMTIIFDGSAGLPTR